MTDTCFEVTINDGIAHIKLNRPEVYNAFNEAMKKELQEALKDVEKDKTVRVVIITGERRRLDEHVLDSALGQMRGEPKRRGTLAGSVDTLECNDHARPPPAAIRPMALSMSVTPPDKPMQPGCA